MLHAAYILLLGLGLSLPWCRMQAADLLMLPLVLLCLRPILKESWRSHAAPLVVLGLTALAAIIHICTDGAPMLPLFEWIVFAYCILLYACFRHANTSPGAQWKLGAILICCVFGLWLADLAIFLATPNVTSPFCMVSGKMSQTALPFLARRFCGCFTNPNMLASFLCLPLTLVLVPALQDSRLFRRTLYLLPLLFIPLCCTLSKHLVLCLGLLCGFGISWLNIHYPKLKHTWLLLLPLTGLILVLETTVLFTTFPISHSAPFISTTPGMYTIHQKTYLHILKQGGKWFGIHPKHLPQLYRQHVNAPEAKQILTHYNSLEDLPAFCNYMDPHCEYLNIPVLFGIPALLAFLLLFFHIFKQSTTPWLAAGFILAVLASMLWDDILSKRAIWISLALLSPHTKPVHE